MILEFKGVRGSIPVPESTAMKYGGNTTCIHVEDKLGRDYIFDAGTGIRQLGNQLFEKHGTSGTYSLFVTHGHYDHIQGFPFFKPAFFPGTHLNIYGANDGIVRMLSDQQRQSDTTHFTRDQLEGLTVTNTSQASNRTKSIFEHHQHTKHFPVSIEKMGAEIFFYDLAEYERIGKDFMVSPMFLSSHPGGITSYLIAEDDRRIFILPDHEHDGKDEMDFGHNDKKIITRAYGADAMIIDGQYTNGEYKRCKGWGHSQMERICHIAAEANVKNLFIMHHDPAHTDAQMDGFAANLPHYMATNVGANIPVHLAREGMQLEVKENQPLKIIMPQR